MNTIFLELKLILKPLSLGKVIFPVPLSIINLYSIIKSFSNRIFSFNLLIT